ncbi:MAG: hypothetical protein KJ864_02345 [Candidatus Omnitrophica bacterium]|nr:hypothetical protein [Candidatus Omnitrophota bacterium]MBU1895092.1 hypothetical protein [Candidatus Omnitrophota bacterium]
MADEPKKWKGWWYFITNNWTFTTWLVIAGFILAGVWFIRYTAEQREIGREEMKGKTPVYKGITPENLKQKVEALKKGYREVIVEDPETGEVSELLIDNLLPINNKNSKFKAIGAGSFDGLDFGLGYEIYDFNVPLVGNVNIDFPIVMLERWGGGVSKDITPDVDAGVGMFFPYKGVKSWEDMQAQKEGWMYVTKHF